MLAQEAEYKECYEALIIAKRREEMHESFLSAQRNPQQLASAIQMPFQSLPPRGTSYYQSTTPKSSAQPTNLGTKLGPGPFPALSKGRWRGGSGGTGGPQGLLEDHTRDHTTRD